MGRKSQNRRGYQRRKMGGIQGGSVSPEGEAPSLPEQAAAFRAEIDGMARDIADLKQWREQVENRLPRPRAPRKSTSNPSLKRLTLKGLDEKFEKKVGALNRDWMRKFSLLGMVSLILIVFIAGMGIWAWSEMGRMDQEISNLAQQNYDLGKRVGALEGTKLTVLNALVDQAERISALEEDVQALSSRDADLEKRVSALESALACEGSYVVESGNTVWGILKEKLGRNPTGLEIQTVVDANHLGSYTSSDGTWIVLIYPGQTLDLSEVVCG